MDEKQRNIKAPRFVHMKKGDKGFGFNLHGERGVVGQYISAVDNGGPAQQGGLCVGDRVIEVNGINVEAATHAQVVAKIKEGVGETALLVVDKVTDDYMKQHGIAITADLAKLDTVVNKVKEEKVEEIVEEKFEVQSEERAKTDENVSVSTDESQAQKDEVEIEEVGMSIEDYLKMHGDVDEGKPAETREEVSPIVHETNDEAAEAPEVRVVVQTEEARTEINEIKTSPEAEVKQVENKVKMTPPEEPPPAPPSETAPIIPAVEESKPIAEAVEVPEPVKAPEPIKAPEPEPIKAPEPEPAKAPEPEPAKAPEPEPAKAPEPEPRAHIDPILKKGASLPKPKRKEIKEKKGTDWAARAAIFNNL